MDLGTSGSEIDITLRTTVEDLLNYKKSELTNFLREKNLKISGSKKQLAERIVLAINENTAALPLSSQLSESSKNADIPDIKELKSGWSGTTKKYFPKISVKDVENYLIKSSHRTNDRKKMQ